MENLKRFIFADKQPRAQFKTAASIFSGGGISDIGYELAGFHLYTQAELDDKRAALCSLNFPLSRMLMGDINQNTTSFIEAYMDISETQQLDLLSITPPCQGMSSSNPGRGKASIPQQRDSRNKLLLSALPVIASLRPRIIVAENVIQILKEMTQEGSEQTSVLEVFRKALTDYSLFSGIIQIADYGIPQVRKRAILVAIRKDNPLVNTLIKLDLLPWPRHTHSNPTISSNKLSTWLTVSGWFNHMKYHPLDARQRQSAKDASDPLHFVPDYENDLDRYIQIADIPPRSGRNAYQNSRCHLCGATNVPVGIAYCHICNAPMTNRPYVKENERYRLIKGFNSSYRRMFPDQPAPTITTNSSHVGSDYKIHPWENRVLSIRECADLQTIPRFYAWDWALKNRHTYVARQVIGEALPPWFTYLHGQLLYSMLDNIFDPECYERLK